MARATNAVMSGLYYYEVEILESFSENAHVRIGWSTRQGELQAPVGFDKHSFAYRDIDGECSSVMVNALSSNSDMFAHPGRLIGSRVHDSVRIDNYGAAYGEGDIIGCSIRLDEFDPNNNEIRYFVNGKDQGVAFKGLEIPRAMFFPAISLYMKAHVRVNFGPSFVVKPNISGYLPVSEVQPMSMHDRKIHEQRISTIRAERASNSQRSMDDENSSMIMSIVSDLDR
jgi:hypothetical protein